MWLINLTISLFSILKVRALECVSVVNQKCMPRPKILDVNALEVVIRLIILWQNCAFLLSLRE